MQYNFAEDIWFYRCPACNAELEAGTKEILIQLFNRHVAKVHP